MYDVEQICLKLGMPTYTDTYFTKLDGSEVEVKVGQIMPEVIGWIYGISTYTTGTLPNDKNKNLIGQADPASLYIQFKLGASLFMNNLRVDQYHFFTGINNGVPATDLRYMPVNIPYQTDLKESFYLNPTGIGTGATVYVPLSVKFIKRSDYKKLLEKGYLHSGMDSVPDKRKPVKK